MRLDNYNTGEYSAGRGLAWQLLWFFVGQPLLAAYMLPFSTLKVWVLRAFGASIGRGVRIKPGIKVKFPWRLRVGDNSWLGERVWIDNLAPVSIGSNCCVSQGVYVCTGDHDWSSDSFDLITRAITISDHAWVAAFGRLAPGTIMQAGSILTLGSVASGVLESWSIYQGNPASYVRARNRPESCVADQSDVGLQ